MITCLTHAYFTTDRAAAWPLSLDFVSPPPPALILPFFFGLPTWMSSSTLSRGPSCSQKTWKQKYGKLFQYLLQQGDQPILENMLIIPTIHPPSATCNTSSFLLWPFRGNIACYRSSYPRIFTSYHHVHRLPSFVFAKAVMPQICHPTF